MYFFWIILTLIKQFDEKLFGYAKYDIFALVPNWTLFAPSPKYSDHKIFYRDLLDDGSSSDLKEINFGKSSFKNCLWKGQCREQKFLSVICKDAEKYKKRKIDLVFFYEIKLLMFKNYISNYKISPNIKNRQLVVVETFGYLIHRREKIIFVTDIKCNND